MHVALTGATGFIGSAVLPELIARGHSVTAVVRSDAAAAAVEAAGATASRVSILDVAALAELFATVDAAIHTASPGDEKSPAVDDAVIAAIESAFSGTRKPFVHTGGVWSWGNTSELTEDAPLDPPALVAWKTERQARLLSLDVNASIVAPAVVYGDGGGIPAIVASDATLIGSGEQHWTTVHRADLAELYVSVLESAPGGEIYVGASGENFTVRELTEAAHGSVQPSTVDETRARFGEGFADALLLDQQATGQKAKNAFGWQPSRASLLEELRAGYGK